MRRRLGYFVHLRLFGVLGPQFGVGSLGLLASVLAGVTSFSPSFLGLGFVGFAL